MQTTAEIIQRVTEFEKSGYSRDQAIEMIKVERMIVLNNQLKELNENIKHKDIERM
jgi:hypothetical protein